MIDVAWPANRCVVHSPLTGRGSEQGEEAKGEEIGLLTRPYEEKSYI